VQLILPGKGAKRLIIPIGPIENSDRRAVKLADATNSSDKLPGNWHTIQIHAKETISCTANYTPLSGGERGSLIYDFFMKQVPYLGSNENRVEQPPKSVGSRSPSSIRSERVSATGSHINS
jgi:hypothetical protein